MDSAILSGLAKLRDFSLKIMKNSFSYKVFTAISRFIKRTVGGSALFGYFIKPVDYENPGIKNSRIYKLLSVVLKKTGKAFSLMGNTTGKVLRSSRILCNLYDFYYNILFQPIKTFGIMGASAAVSYFILSALINGISAFGIISSSVAIGVSVLLMFLDTTLYQLLENSFIIKFACGKDGSLAQLGLENKSKKKSHYILSAGIGSIIAVLPVLLPTTYAMAGAWPQ